MSALDKAYEDGVAAGRRENAEYAEDCIVALVCIRGIADFPNKPGDEMLPNLMGRLESIWKIANHAAINAALATSSNPSGVGNTGAGTAREQHAHEPGSRNFTHHSARNSGSTAGKTADRESGASQPEGAGHDEALTAYKLPQPPVWKVGETAHIHLSDHRGQTTEGKVVMVLSVPGWGIPNYLIEVDCPSMDALLEVRDGYTMRRSPLTKADYALPFEEDEDCSRVVLRCPGDGCQGCPGCAAPANSSSDVPVVPRADPIPTSWLDPLLTGPNAVIGKPPYGCDDIETLLTAIRERIRVSAPEGPRHEPICTCGSDCVPGPAHLPGCPSRDSPEEPRHAASCLSWRKLPCNCRDEPPKEREL